jgi:hypothetical protein
MPTDITGEAPLRDFMMDIPDYGITEVDLTVTADRIIDITDLCENAQRDFEQVVLKYGRHSRGHISQFHHRDDSDAVGGTTMHFFYEGGLYDLATDKSFQSRARIFGCEVATLAQVVIEYAPDDMR